MTTLYTADLPDGGTVRIQHPGLSEGVTKGIDLPPGTRVTVADPTEPPEWSDEPAGDSVESRLAAVEAVTQWAVEGLRARIVAVLENTEYEDIGFRSALEALADELVEAIK